MTLPDGFELRAIGRTDTGHFVWQAARVGGDLVGLPRKNKRNAVIDAKIAALWRTHRGPLVVTIPVLEPTLPRVGFTAFHPLD